MSHVTKSFRENSLALNTVRMLPSLLSIPKSQVYGFQKSNGFYLEVERLASLTTVWQTLLSGPQSSSACQDRVHFKQFLQSPICLILLSNGSTVQQIICTPAAWQVGAVQGAGERSEQKRQDPALVGVKIIYLPSSSPHPQIWRKLHFPSLDTKENFL